MNLFTLFEYRNDKLHWKIKPCPKVRIGDEAGSVNGDGYLQIRYKGKSYYNHRIIWEMHNGPIPEGMQIDHIKGKTDNQIHNLRLVTSLQNGWNRGKSLRNTSDFKGVRWYKRDQKWEPFIAIHGKWKSLGRFDTKEEAYAVRVKAEKELHGEYAASEERKEGKFK